MATKNHCHYLSPWFLKSTSQNLSGVQPKMEPTRSFFAKINQKPVYQAIPFQERNSPLIGPFPYSSTNEHTETGEGLMFCGCFNHVHAASQMRRFLALTKATSSRNSISPSVSVELHLQRLRNWELSPNDSVAQRREVLQDFMNNKKNPIKSFWKPCPFCCSFL